jgi:hypothetical protein
MFQVCAICHNPFIDPVTTSSCKHTFCKSCIIQSLTHRRLCPIDRSQIDQSTLQDAGPVVRNVSCRAPLLGHQLMLDLGGAKSEMYK